MTTALADFYRAVLTDLDRQRSKPGSPIHAIDNYKRVIKHELHQQGVIR